MRQRTRAHELETLSKRDFASRIPLDWVDRPIDAADDYGIDRQVEIFNAGRPTGLELYVQLKATDQELARAFAMSLAAKHRDHYASLALPVLMCPFHAPTGRMFAKWFHTYDPHYSRARSPEGAATFTFRWEETDEWVEHTPERRRDAHGGRAGQRRAGHDRAPGLRAAAPTKLRGLAEQLGH